METSNAKQILSNLYGLLMEINLHREDKDVLDELAARPDPQIEKHLIKIRQLTAKFNAQANKLAFHHAVQKLRELKNKGAEELKKLFNPQEQDQLVTLFRKFDDFSSTDEASLLEDEQFLNCMNLLKSKLDEPEQ